MEQNRKEFLRRLSSGLIVAGMPSISLANDRISIDKNDFTAEGAATDEKFWKKIAKKYYELDGDYINLENGYYGIQPKPVLEVFQKNVVKANAQAARFARKDYPAIAAAAKKDVAAFLGVADDEIIITRNATEALNIAIQGYPFKQGDEVILNQLDYFSMIETFRMLEKRGEISVKEFEMPLLPESEEEIVEIYRKLITDKTRVILLTHVSNINGLIVPVAKIAAMAKERGVDVITDSAHALGQIRFSLKELNSDFVGMNLHKWIGNPVGAGILYVKKERIKELKPLFGDTAAAETNINKLAHFGTTPFAVMMTIPTSLAFQQQLGIERISARLHYLKSVWVNELKQHPNVDVVVPAEFSCAIASFRIKNKTAVEAADYLLTQHKIFTVARTLGKDGCVRVTPSVYNSVDDIKRFITAVKAGANS
jgi:selenocysteine lyase/cysteine desulfurase